MAPFADLGPPAAFQRFVDHDIQGATGLDKGRDDAREQVPTRLQRRPASPVEHLVKRAEMGILLMAGVPPRRGDRSAATREQHAPQQGQHLLPGRGRKQATERFQHGYNGGSTRHEGSPEQDDRALATAILALKSLMPCSSSGKCTKSSSGLVARSSMFA